MSDDLISRQSAIDCVFKRIEELRVSSEYRRKHVDIDVQGIARLIAELPAVQPKEKTGKWIKDEDGKVTCNNCYEYSIATDNIVGATDLLEVITLTMKYCPNCGAKMEV